MTLILIFFPTLFIFKLEIVYSHNINNYSLQKQNMFHSIQYSFNFANIFIYIKNICSKIRVQTFYK